jgi:hypothetical protein
MCSYQEIEGEVIADEKWIPTQVTDSNDGERGRNRTYNLLIKSESSCVSKGARPPVKSMVRQTSAFRPHPPSVLRPTVDGFRKKPLPCLPPWLRCKGFADIRGHEETKIPVWRLRVRHAAPASFLGQVPDFEEASTRAAYLTASACEACPETVAVVLLPDAGMRDCGNACQACWETGRDNPRTSCTECERHRST